jgi:hypothetical protein
MTCKYSAACGPRGTKKKIGFLRKKYHSTTSCGSKFGKLMRHKCVLRETKRQEESDHQSATKQIGKQAQKRFLIMNVVRMADRRKKVA